MINFTVNRFKDKERVVEETSMVTTSVVAEIIDNDSIVGTVFLHDQEVTKHYSAEDEDGRSHTVGDVESGIFLLKELHEESENKKIKLSIEYKEIADKASKYGLDSEYAYVNNGNVRIYINNIFLMQDKLDSIQEKLAKIEASKSDAGYTSVPDVLKEVVDEKVSYLQSEIDKLQKDIDKESKYLKSSVESVTK